MSIVFPKNRKEVADRIVSDIQNELPELTPSLRNSIIRSLVIGFAGVEFDIYQQIKAALIELFPDTASTLIFTERWGLFKGIDLRPATPAIGLITATGLAGTVVPQGTLFQNPSNLDYEAINQDYTIQDVSLSLSDLSRSGSTAIAVTSVEHNFASNIEVAISGADQPEYNGTFVITVVDSNTFSYLITGTPATPATGTILAESTLASIDVQSADSGNIQNLSNGQQLTLKNPIAGADDNAFVQFTAITGGQDEETIEEYRDRYLEAYRNPISNFNDADIMAVLREIPGITKSWVFDATPQPGQCEIYFIRANDEGSIFPDSNELATAKTEILKIKTAPMRDEDVFVLSPTPVNVDFVFTLLTPNSQALQAAINESLKQLFLDETNVGENLTEDAYRSAIFRTINPETGEFVQSFSLSEPVGDVTIGSGELPSLGTITYNVA